MTFDEIIAKFVDGGLLRNIQYVVKNLEVDPDIIGDTDRAKSALLKFLRDIEVQFDEFLEDGTIDERDGVDDDDIFGDDDIICKEGQGPNMDFLNMDDDDPNNPFKDFPDLNSGDNPFGEDDPTEGEEWKKGTDYE